MVRWREWCGVYGNERCKGVEGGRGVIGECRGGSLFCFTATVTAKQCILVNKSIQKRHRRRRRHHHHRRRRHRYHYHYHHYHHHHHHHLCRHRRYHHHHYKYHHHHHHPYPPITHHNHYHHHHLYNDRRNHHNHQVQLPSRSFTVRVSADAATAGFTRPCRAERHHLDHSNSATNCLTRLCPSFLLPPRPNSNT